ncbi:uncharacterized protein LOC128285488 [Gossypium arboreum]|uniref:uncharacterized protein LOC128285488 n=1 Tax=Gossypium arboreum TaxID=29729 RepID=UPI0022F17F2C|nr:uncharacterized protein LOC128285488 [Gossypium arboreum]
MVQSGIAGNFSIDEHDCLRFHNRICVPNVSKLKELILREAHDSPFTLHLIGTKMYCDLRELYWWLALYGRRCRLPVCWTELNERKVIGPELIQEIEDTVKKIRERLKKTFDRQKSYADLKRRDIEYTIGGKVFLKVSPWKKIMRFGRKGKLSLHFIRPYEIIERLGPVAYRLALPSELQKIHDIFHVSMLKRYRSDPSYIISTEDIEIRPDLSYEEEPIKILAHEIKELRNKRVLLVKILWKSHNIEEATWELEEAMRSQYPHLFLSKF